MDVDEESTAVVRDIKVEDSLPQSKSEDVKPTYKSFKKKYRKMRIKFDEKMRQSNDWYVEEQRAIGTAKRLAQENDRLLDLLLDVNTSTRIPADKRIDLALDLPASSAVPALVELDAFSKTAEFDTPESQAVYKEIRDLLDKEAASIAVSRPSKSLAHLMQSTPHISMNSSLVSQDLISSLQAPEGYPAPISYLTPDQIDDAFFDMDSSLGTAAAPHSHSQSATQQDLALRNPHSVYNWLRRHEPKIFLQDGEGSEKSLGKPGALRGAGKRASIPAPSKPDSLEFVEEDGLGYDVTLGGHVGTKGKRKRDGDDDTYTPKGTRPDEVKKKRPYNKKKKTEGVTETSSRKSKGKGRTSSPPPPDPVSVNST